MSEPQPPRAGKIRATEVFTPGFFINYLLSLVLTSWIPVMRFTFVGEDGTVLSEIDRSIYGLYLDVFQEPATWKVYLYLGIHLVVVFLITYAIWYLVLSRARRSREGLPT